MESPQTGLLERLRAQRESMHAGGTATAAPSTSDVPMPGMDTPTPRPDDAGQGRSPMTMAVTPIVERSGVSDEHAVRIQRLESNHEEIRSRLDSIEANLRGGLSDLRAELPGVVTAEVTRHLTPTNEAVAEIGGRLGRMENDFTRERERWSNVVTSFDQRLDQRLRSFRQDVTVMLTGMAVLILAMLMLLLLRR